MTLEWVRWGAALFVGGMFVWSAIDPPRKETRPYLRIVIAIVGFWLLYIGCKHLVRDYWR